MKSRLLPQRLAGSSNTEYFTKLPQCRHVQPRGRSYATHISPSQASISTQKNNASTPLTEAERHERLRPFMKPSSSSSSSPFASRLDNFKDTEISSDPNTESNETFAENTPFAGSTASFTDLKNTAESLRAQDSLGNNCRVWKHGGENLIRIRFAPKQIGMQHLARSYTPLWLRDHCQCSKCVHPDTKQRLLDTHSIPLDIQPGFLSIDESGVRIKWEPDSHDSFYPRPWLEQHHFLAHGKRRLELDEPKVLLGNNPNPADVTVNYEEVMASDQGVAEWTSKIHRFGYCYVDGCPVTPEATEALLKRIAFIRDTHYGAFWDFTSDLTHKDTAYTSLPLNAHTDTTYFTDPAGLQLFHLLSHTDGSGGASLLVDGFQAADILQSEAPEAYRALSRVRLPWHASGNEGLSIQPATQFPVLERWRSSGESKKATLQRVRWNNDDRGTMDLWDSIPECNDWYRAARLWASILKRKELEIWQQLKPGKPLIFDNWRMLHGRSEFTGKRRLCGGYINRDDFMSKYRMTNFGREAVLTAV